jgi:hypothetical protein
VVERLEPPPDAHVGELDVLEHEERPDASADPPSHRGVEVVDGEGDLDGSPEHEPRP